MTSAHARDGGRIAATGFGLAIDRTKPLSFTFDGRVFNGFDGDVVASALYAEGQVMLSRSFKYHRPRGVLTMAGHDANTLVQVADEPNARADRQPISQGLAVTSLNHFGSLERDAAAIMDKLDRFLPVGFYYKTFFRPQGVWKYFEKPIRVMAGLGRLEPRAKPRYYDKAYVFADVLVVGGGIAGLEAAIAAARAGADTLLVDEWFELGGSLLYGRLDGSREAADATRHKLIAAARGEPNLRIMSSATVSGLFADNWASIISCNRLYKLRAKQTIVAAGSFEQPIVFANNDRPGVMFSEAAQRLMRLYGVLPGKRAVVATANRFGYDAALDLLDAGAEVAAVVDLNATPSGAAVDAVRARGVRIVQHAAPCDVRGRKRVESVGIASLRSDGTLSQAIDWVAADVLVTGAGFAPAVNLASHAGAKVSYDDTIHMHRAMDLPAFVSLAGAAAGIWDETRVAEDARLKGAAAARAALSADPSERLIDTPVDPSAATVTHPYPIFAGGKGKDFIDFDEDLKTKDIVNTIKDGYDDIQLVKRYSTAGLGPSQGRHANLNTIRVVGKVTGKTLKSIGTTTYRPPLVPEKFAHMAGRAFEPTRLTPMHQRHVELGASFMTAGLWLRPAYYGTENDRERAIAAEVRAVREAAGLIDVSTLGGFEIRGPDAATFMDRIYTWSYVKQPVGRARYTVMTDEAGVVIDDGVACRLAETHYYVTATTGAADQVYRAMTWNRLNWQLDVDITNVGAAWAAVNLAGPLARTIIETLESDIDFSKEAFPYMAVRSGHLAGIPVRIARVGFVGEAGYEIHCPAGNGEALWDILMDKGAAHGLMAFGVEAQRVLRLEKGHIIVGQDTDGLTTPDEAGLDFAVGKNKTAFVGKRAIDIMRAKGIERRLVGFSLERAMAAKIKECHLIIENGAIVGRVTSVAPSATLNRTIGLAYMPPRLASAGTEIAIRIDNGELIPARITETPFYDPGNTRQEV